MNKFTYFKLFLIKLKERYFFYEIKKNVKKQMKWIEKNNIRTPIYPAIQGAKEDAEKVTDDLIKFGEELEQKSKEFWE